MEVVRAAAKLGSEAQRKAAVTVAQKSYSYSQILKSAFELSNVLRAGYFQSATCGQLPEDDCIEETDVAVSHLEKTIKRSDNLDGARVGIIAKPSAEFVAGMWATWICGGVAVPLALSYPEAELLHVMNDAGVSVVLGTEEYLELLEKISKKCSAHFHLLPLVPDLPLNVDASETRDIQDESSSCSSSFFFSLTQLPTSPSSSLSLSSSLYCRLKLIGRCIPGEYERGSSSQWRPWAVEKPIQGILGRRCVARAAVGAEELQETSVSLKGVENLVIIGSGPAGYTAAIYAARANLKPIIFEGYQAGGVPGGQLMTTTEVENFPGFPDGITGPDLMDRMRRQAERWGAELFHEDVEQVDLKNRPFTIRSSEREVKCHSLIVATGATARRLGFPREKEFWSRGISACAICDGASPLFKGQELAVVGGGDTATEEAIYLTKYARHVHLLVRKDRLRASKAMQDRILNNPTVTVHFSTGVIDVVSNNKGQMSGVLLEDMNTGKQWILDVKGLFYGIGHMPNSQILEGQVELDSAGYVVVKNSGANTSVEGVFAAGDLQDPEWRQAVTAAGSGCMAALSAERYLVKSNLLIEFHQPKTQETKEDLTDKDVQMGFDISLGKHKGQYALRKLYHESPRLICVFYTSPTCGPCRTLKPILSKVIDEFDNEVHCVEIDIEEDPEIAEAAGIMGTPCIQFFKNKEKLKQISGVKMKREYREFIAANM